MRTFLTFCIFFAGFHLADGTFTTNPPTSGENCTGNNVQITWEYTTLEIVFLVQWSKDGKMVMSFDPIDNKLSYGQGFSAANISHDNDNGQITLKSVDPSFSGTFNCEYVDGLGKTYVSGKYILQIYDTITSRMTCSCNTTEIKCTLPPAISQVTINGTLQSLPYQPSTSSTYSVCMTGGAISCLVNNVDRCEIVDICPLGGNGGNGDDKCNAILILLVCFAVSLIVMTITFVVVLLLSCKFPNVGEVVIIVSFFVIDVVFEIFILWGIEYGTNFKFFQSDSECAVVLIGVVCHLVTLLIEVVKAAVLYCYMNKLKKRFFGTCISPESKATENAKIEDVGDRKTCSNLISNGSEGKSCPSAEDRTEKEAKSEDVMILMHFTLPEGYLVDTWATENTSSINDTSKYRPSDRGSLCIKYATKKDNGIYQSILKSKDSEQRINAVLHVTDKKSVGLIIHPQIWRRLSSKKLKKMRELKDVRHKLSTKKVDDIEMKKEDKSYVSVKSIRWKHNGRGIPSNYNNDEKEVRPLEVVKKDPTDEYHCTVEFSNKKFHVYIFIVKFTGARSGNSEDVIGVPTIMTTKREEEIHSLPPIRHTGTTVSANQDPESSPIQGNDLHPVTARSTQSAAI